MPQADWTIRSGDWTTFVEETAFPAGTVQTTSAEAKTITTTPTTLNVADAAVFPNDRAFIQIAGTNCEYNGKTVNTLNNVRTVAGSVAVSVSGAVRLQNGALQPGADGSILIHNATQATDTDREIEFEMASNQSQAAQSGSANYPYTPTDTVVGAVMRWTAGVNKGNHYLLGVTNEVTSEAGKTHAVRRFFIYRYNDAMNTYTQLAAQQEPTTDNGRYSSSDVNVPIKVTCRVVGSSLVILRNDAIAATAVDSSYSAGQTGIGRYNRGVVRVDEEIKINRAVIRAL